MTFSVSFNPPVPSDVGDGSTLLELESSDDFEVLIIEACSALSAARGSRFNVGGFGVNEWPVDVSYDLAAFMEQLPALLAAVRQRREFTLDLYSQGVERDLTFYSVDDRVVIRCVSRTDWVPIPEDEIMARDELLVMLAKLAEDFAKGLHAVNPAWLKLSPFSSWFNGEV